MDELSSTQASLDDLNATVDNYEAKENAAIADLNATISKLTAQLAAGPPGLTAAQGQGLRDEIAVIKAKLQVPITSTVTQVVATPGTLALQVGGTGQITGTAQDAGGNAVVGPLAYVSSDTTVATVDAAGLVTAVKAGSAVITVSSGNPSATVSVSVS